jgi:hypothetical protein
MIVNEFAFEVLHREQEARLLVELERRRIQLERAAEERQGEPERHAWFFLRQPAERARRTAHRHAH